MKKRYKIFEMKEVSIIDAFDNESHSTWVLIEWDGMGPYQTEYEAVSALEKALKNANQKQKMSQFVIQPCWTLI